ncbi:MAG: spore maturation protein [Eubacteriales bacterium]|nr:spore maturation protein [Eubacteriales bacterium]
MANVLSHLSSVIIPALIFYIIGCGIIHKTNVYEDFIRGAADGLKTVAAVAPTLIGLMMAVGILRASGLLDLTGSLFGRLFCSLSLPAELFPLILIRLFSSSAATGLVLDIFKTYGTDSRMGLIASLLMSCTETCFYTMSVYFLAAKVTKTRHTLAGALLATLTGIVMSVLLAGMMG